MVCNTLHRERKMLITTFYFEMRMCNLTLKLVLAFQTLLFSRILCYELTRFLKLTCFFMLISSSDLRRESYKNGCETDNYTLITQNAHALILFQRLSKSFLQEFLISSSWWQISIVCLCWSFVVMLVVFSLFIIVQKFSMGFIFRLFLDHGRMFILEPAFSHIRIREKKIKRDQQCCAIRIKNEQSSFGS